MVYKALWVSHVSFALLKQFLNFFQAEKIQTQVMVTYISLWDVRVLAVSWVILCVVFYLLLQTCSVTSLVLINSNPVPEEQERWCG